MFWAGEEPKNNHGIGLTVYDPEKTIIYQAYDSLVILHRLMDGEYIVEIEIYDPLVKTEYEITVKGILGSRAYTFSDEFEISESVGFKKKCFSIVKDKAHYSIKSELKRNYQ